MKQLKLEGENLNDIKHQCEIWHHECSKEKGASVNKHYQMNEEYSVTLISAKLSASIVKAMLNRTGIYLSNIKVEQPKAQPVAQDKPKPDHSHKPNHNHGKK